MTRERAAELLSEVTVFDDPEMAEAHRVAISALRQQDHFRDLTKKVEPLTLDELRQMDGEPVWCVSLGAKLSRGDGWDIGVNNWHMGGYGKTWVAYRHKKEV